MNNKNFKIGFIVLGGMVRRMARRLAEHGFHLMVFDRCEEQMNSAVSAGAIAAERARALAARSDVIISCLTNDQAVLDVSALGGVLCPQPGHGTIVVEMSTVRPDFAAVGGAGS